MKKIFLKSAREKTYTAYGVKTIKIMINFLLETMETRRRQGKGRSYENHLSSETFKSPEKKGAQILT